MLGQRDEQDAVPTPPVGGHNLKGLSHRDNFGMMWKRLKYRGMWCIWWRGYAGRPALRVRKALLEVNPVLNLVRDQGGVVSAKINVID